VGWTRPRDDSRAVKIRKQLSRNRSRKIRSATEGLSDSPFPLQKAFFEVLLRCNLTFSLHLEKNRFVVSAHSAQIVPSRMRGTGAESNTDMGTDGHDALQDPSRDMGQLELALLRRGVDQRAAGSERCSQCRRSPLIGERVYVYGHGSILCELCRALGDEPPLDSRLVHGPAFGHTLRVIDQRAA
jgi:hypothetical protein